MSPKINTYKPYHIVDAETGRLIDKFYHINVAREWIHYYERLMLVDLKIKKVKE